MESSRSSWKAGWKKPSNGSDERIRRGGRIDDRGPMARNIRTKVRTTNTISELRILTQTNKTQSLCG